MSGIKGGWRRRCLVVMLLVLVIVSKQSLRAVVMFFCTESANFDELAGVMNSFIYKLLDSDYFTFVYRILHLRRTILTPLIIPLCNSLCLRNLSQKIVSINYLHCFRQKNGAPPLGPAKCATKGARRGAGSFELNPGLHELKHSTK